MKNLQSIKMSCHPQDKQLNNFKKKKNQVLAVEGVGLDLGVGSHTSRSGRQARDYHQTTILYKFVKDATLVLV